MASSESGMKRADCQRCILNSKWLADWLQTDSQISNTSSLAVMSLKPLSTLDRLGIVNTSLSYRHEKLKKLAHWLSLKFLRFQVPIPPVEDI